MHAVADLFKEFDVGARVHTNSWGSDVFGEYTASSQEADQFAWDNKDFLILFSAGNEGVDSDGDGVIDLHSLGSPATAKNVLTVGASENDNQGGGAWSDWYAPVAPVSPDLRSDNVDGLSAFSSRGPTDDGRTKPDIVAPGTFVNSVCSTQTTGGCAADYVLFAGTSMSTPLTAGAAAVARQVYSSTLGYAPSAAMLKSMLANGATDMHPGQYGTGATQEIPSTRPTHQAGWGRVDLEDSLFESGSRVIRWWDISSLSAASSSYQPLSTAGTATYTLEVRSSATPLAATLAWTDYPGSLPAAGGLVNDLDLLLTGPAGTYYANNAAQRDNSEPLDPVGGAFTHVRVFSNGEKYAMEMNPAQYPAVPAFAKLWFYNLTGLTSGSVNFDLLIYDDDGAGPGPNGGTVLCTLSGKRAAWGSAVQPYATVVDLSSCGASIPGGVFYLSVEFTSTPTSGGRFLMRSTPGLAFQDTGSGWSADSSFNYAWAATVYQPVTPGTSFDRVNNLVGIDLASPPTGVYTLTVTGFNIPQGPQPYALTLSGDYSLLGTETITHTIDSAGIYTFANADLAIEFVSENIDSVSVTVHRDQFPTTGMNTIKRYLEISSSGGLGTFNANLTFGYEQDEFAASGIPSETSLNPFRFTGSNWVQHAAASRDTVANTVTINGVTDFSRWTLGADSPTAVALETFRARSYPAQNLLLLGALLAITLVLLGGFGRRMGKRAR